MKMKEQEKELLNEIASLKLRREVIHIQFDEPQRCWPRTGYLSDPHTKGHFSEINGVITVFPHGDPTIPGMLARRYRGVTIVLLYEADEWVEKMWRKDKSLTGWATVGIAWCSELEHSFSKPTGRLIATGRALKQYRARRPL